MSEHSESWRRVGICTEQEALWVVMVQERDPETLLPCVLIKGLGTSREPHTCLESFVSTVRISALQMQELLQTTLCPRVPPVQAGVS